MTIKAFVICMFLSLWLAIAFAASAHAQFTPVNVYCHISNSTDFVVYLTFEEGTSRSISGSIGPHTNSIYYEPWEIVSAFYWNRQLKYTGPYENITVRADFQYLGVWHTQRYVIPISGQLFDYGRYVEADVYLSFGKVSSGVYRLGW